MFTELGHKVWRKGKLERNLVKTVLSSGGQLVPLLINPAHSNGLGLCNPSILVDEGKLKMILRNVNYTLYHAEATQSFNSRYGPLSYLNPENDIHLRTWNFLCELNPETLQVEKYWKIDTSKLDKEPLWEFVGLEDARLVRWNGSLYGIGVRRDTTPNGQGRMEYSQIYCNEKGCKEIARNRIENTDPNSYCEKNWMPILDMPNCFVKWTNPTAVVEVDLKTNTAKHIYHGTDDQIIPNLPFLRGGSQVIPWGDYRICLVHECDLFRNKLQQKDATYMHRFVVWDRNWNVVRITDPFSFMDGEIEFCAGLALYKGDLLITFGFQDNAAFLLKIPNKVVPGILGFDGKFDWGPINGSDWFRDWLENEIFVRDIYQKFFPVKEGDVVLDIGASVGPFTQKILPSNPSKVICIEPHKGLFAALQRNVGSNPSVICINKGIGEVDDKITISGLFNISEKDFQFIESIVDGITFDTIIADLDHIDFLKSDCEGGEYKIFTEKNFDWISKNVRKIAIEVHLNTDEQRYAFKEFREQYLKKAPWFRVLAANEVDITSEVWSQGFIDYYKNVMVYIDNTQVRKKWSRTSYPTLEICTSIPEKGCPMKCEFCPQDVISSSYEGVTMLKLAEFKKLLDKVPQEIGIVFAGFTEPFLNKDAVDMVRYANEQGHKVSVFTTGVGLDPVDVSKLAFIVYEGVQGNFVLHLPDTEGYFKHELTDAYLETLEALKVQITGLTTVTMGTLPIKLAKMFPDTVLQKMYDRAGNLKNSKAYYTYVESDKGVTCNCKERLYHNVLLPNGDITLCCMDYGLKHILGNLYEQNYEDIMPEDDTPFELCSHCENGRALS